VGEAKSSYIAWLDFPAAHACARARANATRRRRRVEKGGMEGRDLMPGGSWLSRQDSIGRSHFFSPT
jgi:hypothetical protein